MVIKREAESKDRQTLSGKLMNVLKRVAARPERLNEAIRRSDKTKKVSDGL
jgi:hypothetical protein